MQRPQAKAKRSTGGETNQAAAAAAAACPRRYSRLALNCSKEIPKRSPFSRSDAFKDLHHKRNTLPQVAGNTSSQATQPMDYYPTSNSIMHAQPATTSKGSFGPVFAVLAVISFLAVAACIVGRLCGRRLSKKKRSAEQQFYGSNAVGGDLEKGFEVKYPTMKPMASSRAMIHDIEDGFEIKFAPGKPAAWKNDSKAGNKGHHPQPGVPKDYAMPKEYAGFRYPANGVVRQGQIRGGTFVSAKPSS